MAGLTQPRCSAHKRLYGDDDRDGDYDHDGDNKGEDIATQNAMYHITDTQDPLGDDPDDIADPEVSFRDDKAE